MVLDVDSTLTRDEGIDLLAAAISEDVANTVAGITASAMRGEIDFEQSLRQRVGALRGVTRDQMSHAISQVRITPGAQELISRAHELGHLVGAVSGGFHDMVDPLADELTIDIHAANRLEWKGGVLTGEVVGPIIDAKAKASTLEQWTLAHDIDLLNTVAIGDGGNDVEMLRLAGVGIAFMAKPIAQQAADVSINEPDLSLVLGILAERWG